jgi:DNA-binding NarL/FixJ family response regulator
MAKTVLVVDDHEGFRASVRELLESEGFEVVGEAGDAASGIDAARSLRPDIVLLDIQLPDFDGILASERIADLNGGSAIVLTSSCDPVDVAGAVVGSPARGFIPKPELSGERLRALLTPAGR